MRLWLTYLTVGLLLALVCERRLRETSRTERIASFVLAVCAWPLYAPLVLLPALGRTELGESALVLRIRQALLEARAAVAGSALAEVIPKGLVEGLFASLDQVEQRRVELSALLSRPDLQTSGSNPSRLQQQSVQRLRTLYDRDQAMLEELVELAEGLRTQLLVARYSAGSNAGMGGPAFPDEPSVRDLALDLAARVESLSAWFEFDTAQSSANTQNRT